VTDPPPSRIATLARNLLAPALWAAALGVLSGLACIAARLTFRLLQWCFTGHGGLLSDAAAALPLWRRALVPVLGALCAWAVLTARKRWAKVAPSTNYIQAVRRDEGNIPFAPTLWRTVSSAFSVATGAAVGREGSMIQFAAATTSWLARKAGRVEFPRAHQVACGAAAAVATVYQAPIAGVFFAAEIVLGNAQPAVYPLLLIASVSGWLTSRAVLGHGPLFPASAALGAPGVEWFWMVPLALLLGAVSPAYQWLIRSLRPLCDWPLALVWGGLGTGLLSLASPLVWGNGDAALLSLVGSHGVSASRVTKVLALRLAATTLCVGVGTVGGVFTPTLFAGAAAGLLMAHSVHVAAPLLLTVIGLGALLSAVTHAPLMATFMAVELTGRWELLPVLLVSNLLAWLVAARLSPNSLYGIATTTPGDRASAKQ
jgi:CIC family chloride channel protein